MKKEIENDKNLDQVADIHRSASFADSLSNAFEEEERFSLNSSLSCHLNSSRSPSSTPCDHTSSNKHMSPTNDTYKTLDAAAVQQTISQTQAPIKDGDSISENQQQGQQRSASVTPSIIYKNQGEETPSRKETEKQFQKDVIRSEPENTGKIFEAQHKCQKPVDSGFKNLRRWFIASSGVGKTSTEPLVTTPVSSSVQQATLHVHERPEFARDSIAHVRCLNSFQCNCSFVFFPTVHT